MIKARNKHFYVFGAFWIDVTQRVLFKQNVPVTLTPKAFDTLLVLVENSGRVIGKKDLMEQVWPDSFVEENNLAQNISILRKALGDGGPKIIETVPKRGYRFMAEVSETRDDDAELVLHEHTRTRVIIKKETTDDNPADAAKLLPKTFECAPAIVDVTPTSRPQVFPWEFRRQLRARTRKFSARALRHRLVRRQLFLFQ